MNIIFKTLMILFFVCCSNLSATQKQADNIAQISALSLYNIDKDSLQNTMKTYLRNHPNLKSLKIVESLSGESYFSLYFENDKAVYNKGLSKNLKNLKLYKSHAMIENEKVGEIFAYYDESNNNKLNSKEISWIKSNSIIKIAVVKDYKPYDMFDKNNKLVGFHSDIVSLMNEKLDSNIILVPYNSWQDAYNSTISGKTDAIFGLSWSSERESKYFIYSPTYHLTPNYLFVNKENKDIYSFESLKGKKIAIEAKTIFESIVKEDAPLSKVLLVPSLESGFEKLSENKVSAMLTSNLDEELLDKYNLKVASKVYHKSSELYIGTNKNRPIIASILTKGLNSLSLSELKNLKQKWFIDAENKNDLTLQEKKWIEDNPIVKIALMNYWASDDNGNNIHTELLKLFNMYSDLQLLPVKYDKWKNGFKDATEGKVLHGILNLSWSKEREEKNFLYTKAYNFTPSQLIVRSDNNTIKTIKDLKNKNVYTRAQAITNKTLQDEIPSAKVIHLEDELNMYKRLSSSKEADAILDYSLDNNLINSNNLKIVQNVYDKYSEVSLGISKKHPILHSILEKIYAIIPKNELLELQNKVYNKAKVNPTIKLNKIEKDWIKNNPTLKIIKFFNEPPFTINSTPESGYMYELLENISSSAGLKIEYVNNYKSYGSMLEGMEEGKADILTTFPTSLDLGKDSNIVASKSVLKTPFVIVGKSNDNEVEVIEDLFGKNVAVVKGYAQDKYLDKFPKIKKIYVKNNEEGFAAIRKGKASYYVNNRANTEYVLNTSFSTDLRIIYELSYENFPPLSISFAMNGKKKTMVGILQKALEQMSYKDIKNIQDKWIFNNKTQKNNSLNLTKQEKEWIKKHPKIRVHNEKSWAPYNFYEKGRARGLSIDFIKELTNKAGIEIEFVTGPTWGEFMDMSKNKEIDVMLNIVSSPTREKFLNFTEPYSELVQSLYIKKGMKPITKTEELFGKTFVVPKGFYYEEKLKKYPQIKLLRVNNTLECMQAISFGKADAMLDLTTVVNYYKNKHQVNDVVLGGTLGWEGGSLPISMGVRKDWPELVSILNKALSVLEDKELDDIENKWLFNNNIDKTISLNNEERKWIQNNIVKIGVEQWAPVIYSTDGLEIDGITGDVFKIIVEKTGMQTEVITGLWDTLLNRFKDKEIDLLPATYRTEERMKYGLFSSGYFSMLDYIYVQENNTNIKKMSDLKGKKLAIPKGFGTIEKIQKQFPTIQIVETIDLSDSINKVLNGEVDALYDGQIAVEYMIQENLISGLKGIPQNSFKAASIHLFSSEDKPILQSIIQKALNNITKKEINEIKAKWIVNSNSLDNKLNINNEKKELNLTDILPVKEIVIGLLIFLIIFYFIWKYQLKGSNKEFALKGTLFIIIGAFLFLASLITILTINNLEKVQKNEIQESLRTVLNSSYKTIQIWFDAKYRRLDIVLENKDIPKLLKNVDKDNNLEKLKKHFKAFEMVFEDSAYYLFSKDFKNLSSSHNDSEASKIIKDIKKIVNNNKTSRWVSVPHKDGEYTQESILVVKAIKYENRETVGYLVMDVNPKKEFTRILQNGQLGTSGETYAFNENLEFISNSRFDEQLKKLKLLDADKTSFLNMQVKTSNNVPTLLAKNVLEKNAGIDTNGYLDYRDVEVYGAWVWDDKVKIGFATEIDKDEAMGSFNNVKNTIFIIVFSIILFTIFLTLLVAWISKQSKLSLEKSNKELNKLLTSFDENVIASRSDLKGNITYASKAFGEISGYSIEELMGKPHSTVRHSDTPKEFFKELWKTIRSGKVFKGELKNRKKDGGFYWVDVVITPEFSIDGDITGFSAIRNDITAQKEVEELSESLELKVEERTKELQVSQQQFTSMASNVPGVLYRCKVDAVWTMLYISEEIEKLTDYPVSDYINNEVRSFADIMHKDDIEPIAISIAEQIEKSNKFLVDYRVISKNNEIKWVRSQGQASLSQNGVQILDGVLFDITEQRALEQEIKRSQEQMTFVSQYANFGFWNFNPQIGDLFVNDIFVQMLGYDPKEVLMDGYEDKMFKPFRDGLAFWEQLLHIDDVEHTSKEITAHINGETELYKVDYRMKKADGSWMWSTAIGRIAEYDNNGKPIRFNGVNIDIEESKQAQKNIEDQKKYIDSIMDSQSNIVISTDGVVLRTANKSFLEFFDVKSKDEFLEDFGDCICDTFDIDETGMFIQKTTNDEVWIDYVYDRPNELHKTTITRDGIRYIFSITSDKFEFQGEELMVAVFTDITELEKQKKQTEEILASILLPTLITDKATRKIVYANEFANEQYEAENDALVGLSIDHLYTDDHQKEKILNHMKEHGFVKNFETKFKTLKDNNFDALLSLVDIEFDGKDCYLGVASDITKQKNIEQEIRSIHKHTKDSIEYAALIQGALIPSTNLFNKYFNDFFAIWQPKDIVGGDIYLFEELRTKDECLLMVIDCTGHGVPGAFVTMLVKAIERQVVAKIENDTNIVVSPAWILSYFNKTMKKLLKQESDDSISNAGFDGGVLYYNRNENYIKYAGAETPLFYIQNNELNMIKGNRHSIGYKKSDVTYEFDEYKIDIETDTKLYITTDGYLDQNGGEKGFPFGKSKFKELIMKNSDLNFDKQKEILFENMKEYMKDEERNDDTTVVGIEVLASSSTLLGHGI